MSDAWPPLGIGYAVTLELKMGNLAAGEHQQCAAVLHPSDGLPQGLDVIPCRALAVEGIDGDQQLAQLRDALQVDVGEDFDVLTAAQHDMG